MEPVVKVAESSVTVPEPEVVAEKVELPTGAEMKEAGMPADEVKMAEKAGLISKPEDKKPEEKPPEVKLESKPDVPKTFEIEDDPAKEQEKLKDYNDNEKGLYFNMKKDRERRKVAIAERDHLLLQQKIAQQEIEKLKKQIEEKGKTNEDDPFGFLEEEKLDDKKPLTRADLEVIEAEKAEKASKEQTEKMARANVLKAKLDEQETAARIAYPDFDEVTDLTNDILKNAHEIFKGEPKKLAKAIKMAHDFSIAVTNAEKFGETDYNATDIAYEIGQLHPKYKAGNGNGKHSESNNGKTEQDGTSLTPEKIAKLNENSRLRSSASVNGGGGSETVSESDLTPEQAARLTTKQWSALKPETRKRLMSL